MNEFKKYYLMRVIVSTLFGVGCGVLLLLCRPYANEIFEILVIAMGLLIAVMALPALFLALTHLTRRAEDGTRRANVPEVLNLIVSLVAIGLGVSLMLLRNTVLLILLAVYSLVLPLVRIALVSAHGKQFRREVPRMLAGAVMLVVLLTEAEKAVVFWCAIACFVLTALYLAAALLTLQFRYIEHK